MKIIIFYRDAFQKGGVPNEMCEFANALAISHEVTVFGKQGNNLPLFSVGIQCLQYNNLLQLTQNFSKRLEEIKPDLILIVGFFLFENLLVSQFAKASGVPVILNPVSQVTDSIFHGKIFTQDPDVRNLEQNGTQLIQARQKIFGKINPFIKKIYLQTFGFWIVSNSSAIAVFSPFEKEQFTKYFPNFNGEFVKLLWGINQQAIECDQRHFYKDVLGYQDKKANYVYWGRLDWHYKGIDRLLMGVLHCLKTINNADLPFRLFLIGPDYNNGALKIQKFIQTHQLQDTVQLLLPGNYPSGSKTPLRDASASIYLSRWDGFPRTLRESLSFGIPIMASKETHFEELIYEGVNGISFKNSDNRAEIAQALLTWSEPSQNQTETALKQVTEELSWQAVAKKFVNDCNKVLGRTTKQTGHCYAKQ